MKKEEAGRSDKEGRREGEERKAPPTHTHKIKEEEEEEEGEEGEEREKEDRQRKGRRERRSGRWTWR